MATAAANPASEPASAPAPAAAPTPQLVGNAFVEQYYLILHKSPELVFRFYTDQSVLSRPGSDGVMTSVNTQQAINDKILSLNYNEYKAEIKTVDAQLSHKDGVAVLVTGCLIGKDEVKRKFTQSFFLAPQDKGYYVLNDIFRYVDEHDSLENNSVLVNGVSESIQSAPVTPEPEPVHVPEPAVIDHISTAEVILSNGEVGHGPSDTDDGSVVEEEAAVAQGHSVQEEVHPVSELTPTVQEDAPKKSYASILKVTGKAPPVYVATSVRKAPTSAGKVASSGGKVAAPVTDQQPGGAAAPGASAPGSNNTPESSAHPDEVEGYSIYLRSLPLNATVSQVEEEFKKFGPIRPGGIQVRSNKQQGFCFGFVEFELLKSMQDAREASPVLIGGRQVHVEEKRTTTRVGGGRARFPPGRGGFRNDNFRGNDNFRSNDNFRGGRGNYSGGGNDNFRGGRGGGYGRNEYGNRGDFAGRRGPPSGRSGEGGYQPVDRNGNGRVGGRQGGNQAAVTA